MTFKYGSRMSEQLKEILEMTSWPMAVKNPWKDSMVPSRPTRADGDAEVDLINLRQILVPFGVLDFIDADSVDLAGRPMFQAPGDDMFDRVENLVPRCTKGLRRFLP